MWGFGTARMYITRGRAIDANLAGWRFFCCAERSQKMNICKLFGKTTF